MALRRWTIWVFLFGMGLSELKGQVVYNYFGPNQLRDINPDSTESYAINPIAIQTDLLDSLTKSKRLKFAYKDFKLSFNPFTYQVHTNSVIPTNHTSTFLMPNVGLQQFISGGVHIACKNLLEGSFQPIYQTIENLPFDQFPVYSKEWIWYYHYLNNIDLPTRFSTTPIKITLLGPSYLRLKFKGMAFSLSNESKWWGPAHFNPLVLGSNAPGFLHASINPLKPINTSIGKFQFETIFGLLYKSGFYPPDTNRVNELTGARLYKPKIDEDRYITGLVYTYQPRWLTNFTVGFTKLSMAYKNEVKSPYDALPLSGFIGQNVSQLEMQGKKASMGSWFMRYIMPKANAEIYFEYGRADQSLHVWNILQNNAYSRGYTAGLKKAYELNKFPGHFIQFGTEITNLSLPTRELVKSPSPKSWYIHDYVRQGFTHKGMLLGSQLGPGSNGQNIYLQYLNKLNKVGIRFYRTIHNLDFYHYQDYYRENHFAQYWTSVGTLLYGTWHLKNFSLQATYGMQRDLNYQWDWIRYRDVGVENIGNDKYNISLNLMLTYRL